MAGRPVELDADTRDFVELSAKLRQFQPALHKSMRKAAREAVKPGQKAVRDEVLKTPSKRRLKSASEDRALRSYGFRPRLRQGIARGIRIDYVDKPSQRFVGARIRATSAGLPASQKGMQRTYNKRTFRRRVFGTDTWVEQAGHPYFDAPIRRLLPSMRAEFDRVLADAKRDANLR